MKLTLEQITILKYLRAQVEDRRNYSFTSDIHNNPYFTGVTEAFGDVLDMIDELIGHEDEDNSNLV